MERTEEYSLYSLSILVTRGQIGEEEFTSEAVQVHVRVDEEHPYGEIAGIYENQGDSEILFPEKTHFELEEGYAGEFLLYKSYLCGILIAYRQNICKNKKGNKRFIPNTIYMAIM